MEHGDMRSLNWKVSWNMETTDLSTGRYHEIWRRESL